MNLNKFTSPPPEQTAKHERKHSLFNHGWAALMWRQVETGKKDWGCNQHLHVANICCFSFWFSFKFKLTRKRTRRKLDEFANQSTLNLKVKKIESKYHYTLNTLQQYFSMIRLQRAPFQANLK